MVQALKLTFTRCTKPAGIRPQIGALGINLGCSYYYVDLNTFRALVKGTYFWCSTKTGRGLLCSGMGTALMRQDEDKGPRDPGNPALEPHNPHHPAFTRVGVG